MKVIVNAIAGLALAALSASAADAFQIQPSQALSSQVTKVAEGCPAGYWRGPWGQCRDTPYSGRLPGGGWTGGTNGCAPGYWRGPWGQCRDTIYHGRLPDGAYK